MQTQVKLVPDFLYRGVPLELEDQELYATIHSTESAAEFSEKYPLFLEAVTMACTGVEKKCGRRPSKISFRGDAVVGHIPDSAGIVRVPYSRQRLGN